MRTDNLCDSLGGKFGSIIAGNPIYQLTITNRLQTYLTVDDEKQML